MRELVKAIVLSLIEFVLLVGMSYYLMSATRNYYGSEFIVVMASVFVGIIAANIILIQPIRTPMKYLERWALISFVLMVILFWGSLLGRVPCTTRLLLVMSSTFSVTIMGLKWMAEKITTDEPEEEIIILPRHKKLKTVDEIVEEVSNEQKEK